MRLFALLNFQEAAGFFFPSLIFIVVFGVGLAYSHLRFHDSETRKNTITYRFPEGIEDRDAPYPLVMMLIVAGVVIWGFLYILMHGLAGVKV